MLRRRGRRSEAEYGNECDRCINSCRDGGAGAVIEQPARCRYYFTCIGPRGVGGCSGADGVKANVTINVLVFDRFSVTMSQ